MSRGQSPRGGALVWALLAAVAARAAGNALPEETQPLEAFPWSDAQGGQLDAEDVLDHGPGDATPCEARNATVVVPALRGSVSEQRMRMVQDLVAATLLDAAVALPTNVYEDRFADTAAMPLGHLFNVKDMAQKLARLGVCIRDAAEANGTASATAPTILDWEWPLAASDLCHADQRLAVKSRLALPKGPGRYALAPETLCCTGLVPDTDRALALTVAVNAAFSSSRYVTGPASDVVKSVRAAAPGGFFVAVAWPGPFGATSSDDVVASAVVDSLRQAQRRAKDMESAAGDAGRTHALLLGNVTAAQVAALNVLAASDASAPPIHFVPRIELARSINRGGRAGVEQLDREIASQADVFVGAPFASFSALAAMQRWATPELPHAMFDAPLALEGADQLGRTFQILFPSTAEHVAASFPCNVLAYMHESWKAPLAACARRERASLKAGNTVDVLHQLPDTVACPGQDIANQLSDEKGQRVLRQLAYHDFQDQRAAAGQKAILGTPAPAWGCNHTARALESHGLLEDPLTGRLFVRGLEPERMTISGFFRQAWREMATRTRTTPETSLLPATETPEALSCPDVAPAFTFPRPLDDVRDLGRPCHVAVVTSLLGDVDSLYDYADEAAAIRESEAHSGIHICWFAFLDLSARKANLKGQEGSVVGARHGIWQVVDLHADQFHWESAARSRNSRLIKMLSHRAFSSTPFTFYVDAKVRLASPHKVAPLVFHAMQRRASSSPAWVGLRHPKRDSIYEEARCVKLIGLVGDEVLDQMQAYRREGFPGTSSREGGPGLIDGMIHVRDNRRAEASLLGCRWFQEFEKFNHRRDQLSFNYLAWKLEKRVGFLGPVLGYLPDTVRGFQWLTTVRHAHDSYKVRRRGSVCLVPSEDEVAEAIGRLALA